MNVGSPLDRSGIPVTKALDLSPLPTILRILVDKIADAPTEGTRLAARDRLQEYVLRQTQGEITIPQARALNAILVQLELSPVNVPEAATIGSVDQMLAEHLSVDQIWTGSRFAPMPDEVRAARIRSFTEVLARAEQLGVDVTTLDVYGQATMRALLLGAARGLY